MKIIPAAFQAHLDSGLTTLAALWRVVRRDTTSYRLTDHDADIEVSDGYTTVPLLPYETSGATLPAGLRSLVYGQGVLLGLGLYKQETPLTYVGTAVIHRSLDGGLTWGTVALPVSSGDWLRASLAFNGNAFVVIEPNSNLLAVSSDGGSSWTAVTSAVIGGRAYTEIVGGNGVFMAANSGSTTDTKYALSTDNGATWTEYSRPAYMGTSDSPILGFGGNRFYMGGWYATAFGYTDDGVTWTQVTLPNPAGGYVIAAEGNAVLALTYDTGAPDYLESAIVSVSLDKGVTWTTSTLPVAMYQDYPLISDGIMFIASSVPDIQYASVDNGITWFYYTNIGDSGGEYTSAGTPFGICVGGTFKTPRLIRWGSFFSTATYLSAAGYSRTSIASQEGLSVDGIDITAIKSISGILEADLRASKLDGAEVRIDLVNYESPSDGTIRLKTGFLGNTRIDDTTHRVEFRGLADRLQQTIGRVYSRDCDATFGDARCKIDATLPIHNATGTVATVVSDSEFTDPARTEIKWTAGTLTWTSGNNAGVSMEVKQANGAGTIALWNAMPKPIMVGDAYAIRAGCQKRRLEDCVALYNNAVNHRGFDTIPGSDYVTSNYPNAK